MQARPLLLFDGVCNLCHGTVRWVLARDRAGRFDFASLQSEVAARALARAGRTGELPDSVVLVDGNRVFLFSDAAIETARRLGFPWSLLVLAKVLPKALRDGLYRFVARHRYRWFGRREACGLPAPEQAERFLDAQEFQRAPQAAPHSSTDAAGGPPRGPSPG